MAPAVSARKPQQTRRPNVPYGATRADIYRSNYEAAIHKRAPYLLYEPTKYSLEVFNITMAPADAVIVGEDGILMIDQSWVSRGTNRKGDRPWVSRRNHTPDWEIPPEFSATGTTIVIESKGLLTVENRALIRAFRACNPTTDYRMLFMRDSSVPQTKLTTLEWARGQGIEAVAGTKIPDEWVNKIAVAARYNS